MYAISHWPQVTKKGNWKQFKSKKILTLKRKNKNTGTKDLTPHYYNSKKEFFKRSHFLLSIFNP